MLVHAVLVLSGTGCQVFALGLAPAAYVASIRRTSAVFSVLLGSALFRSRAWPDGSGAAMLAVLGAVCLVLGR